jgi:ubiquinone biosynthesis protein UbiJ
VNPIVLAALGAAAAVFGAGGARALSRWLGRAIAESMRDAITTTVQPQLSRVEEKLEASFEVMRAENRVDHQRVATEVAGVANEVAALEVRVSAVETAIKELNQ